MKCKIFHAKHRERLEQEVNTWLETHMVESYFFQFTTVAIESDIEYILEHTIVLFYIPRVGEEN